MTKQEEIRNGLIDLLDGLETPYTDEDNRPRGHVDRILSYLHSQGVVIKVDRELPNPELFEDALSDAWRKGTKKQGIDVSEKADDIKLFLEAAGYEATISIIKEVQSG